MTRKWSTKEKSIEEKIWKRRWNIDVRLINRRPRVINRRSRVLRGKGRKKKSGKGRNFDSHYRYGIPERDDWNFNGGLIIFWRRGTRSKRRTSVKKRIEQGKGNDDRKSVTVKTSDDRYHREHCEARIDHNYCPY